MFLRFPRNCSGHCLWALQEGWVGRSQSAHWRRSLVGGDLAQNFRGLVRALLVYVLLKGAYCWVGLRCQSNLSLQTLKHAVPHVYIWISPYGFTKACPAHMREHTHTHCGLRWFWIILMNFCLAYCFVLSRPMDKNVELAGIQNQNQL